MSSGTSRAALPTLLFLCLLLGGSSQPLGGSLTLQIGAVGIIAWVIISASKYSADGRGLLGLLAAMLVLIAIQIAPLPPELWRSFPGRQQIEAGYLLLGIPTPPLPISLTPHATLSAYLFLLPPIAIILAMLRLGVQSENWLVAALFAGSVLGILLGFVQVATGGNSSLYIYEFTNLGAPVGFFANRNHMGTLLLITLPFTVTLLGGSEGDVSKATSRRILGMGLLAVILLSLAVNGSLAAIALSVPVVVASALLLPGLSRYRAWLGGAAVVAVTGAVVFLADSPVQSKLTGENTSSFDSRAELWSRTWSAIESSFPVGTGVGSFQPVYAMFEPPQDLPAAFANHAHNEYLEIILETGLAGTLLTVAFFAWWSATAIRILRSPVRDRFAGAAIIASAAVLAHSVVDYPLRTSAIAAVFAVCLAFMARRPRGGLANDSVQPARHVTIR